MTTPNINPVHVINRYVYDLLRLNLPNFNRTNYGGRTPIIPSQQLPEFTQYNFPFLVYGYSQNASDDMSTIITNGSLSYAIYSADVGEIVTILNILDTEFNRMDDSARDINTYKFPNASFRDVTFTSFTVGLVEGPGPAESEAGRHSGIFMLRWSSKTRYNIIVPTVMT